MLAFRRIIWVVVLVISCYTATYAQNPDTVKTISGNYIHQKIPDILQDIGSRYGFRFFFRKDWLGSSAVTLNADNLPVTIFLDSLLHPAGLTYVFYYPSVIIIARSEDLAREFTQNYFIEKRRQQDFLQSDKMSEATDHIVLGDSSQIGKAREGLLKGQVFDSSNGEPLPGVNINIESINKIITTGPDGKFSVQLPTGSHFISVSYVGYDTKKFDLALLGNATWNIEIFPHAIQLNEVKITGTQEQSMVHSNVAGITTLTPKDIKSLTMFLGEADVIKSILTVPGVSTTGEGTEGFHVRGGNIDQNLILQDNAILFNSSHALGFFSVFNPDLVKNVTLYKGHIPAQYGGRISSVLDVNLKGFNDDKTQINGGIGLVTGRMSADIPMFNHHTTLIAGGRLTYSDWILRQAENPDVHNSQASFYDYNFKLIQKLPHNGYLSASAYQSYDHLQFTDQFGFKWKNITYGISWEQLFKGDYFNKLSYIYGGQDNQYIKPTNVDAYTLSNGLNYHKVKDELSISSLHNHELVTGIEGILYLASPDVMEPYRESSYVIPESIRRENGLETAVFVNDDYTISHLFSISAGLRYNYFVSLGPSTVYQYRPGEPYSISSGIDSVIYGSGQKIITYGRLAPRFSFKYSPTSVSSIKASYDRMNQFVHLISNTIAPVPVDLWQVSTRYLLPEYADNYSAGYFRNLAGDRWETSVDLFYRASSNIPLYKDFADLKLNPHLETEIINAKGRSYGAEFYIRKVTGNPSGWISYTYSRSMVRSGTQFPETTVNNGDWFPAYFDKPHQVNFVFDLQVTRGSNLSLNYSFSSGRPITAPTANYFYDSYIIPYYPGRNNFRIPNYSRLDMAYTIRRNVVRNHRYNDSVTFSVYNLLSRVNAFSVFFMRTGTGIADAYKLSVLGRAFPSVTYNFNY